jgi:hypothetical protein
MEKFNLNEGNEALNRVLLMMKYDTKKTLTENVEEIEELNWLPGILGNSSKPKPKVSSNKTAADYAKATDPNLDESLSLKNPPKGWLEISYDEIKHLVSDNEGLGDNLDAGTFQMFGGSMSTDDMSQISKTLRSAKNTFFRAQRKSSDEWVCYPMIEGLRAQYGMEESGESLYGEIEDPRGTNSAEAQNWSANTLRLLVSLYQQWLNDSKIQSTPTPNPTPNPNPTPGSNRYHVCTGTYTKGCKTNTTGAIGQVQQCLGLVVDGKFWDKTQVALVSKGFANGFRDSDITTICGGTPPTPSPDPNTIIDNSNDLVDDQGV